MIDGVLDKAQPLAKTDPAIASSIGQINARYTQLCTMARVSVCNSSGQNVFRDRDRAIGVVVIAAVRMCSGTVIEQ